MIPAALVLAVLQLQPPCWADRAVAPEVKAAQLDTIARAIAEVSPDVDRAAMLLTIGYAESRWCLAVHAKGQGLWQLEWAHRRGLVVSGLSPDATGGAAKLASDHIGTSWQCGPSVADRLTAYAGRPCGLALGGWPTLRARVRGYWWAVSALRRGLCSGGRPCRLA